MLSLTKCCAIAVGVAALSIGRSAAAQPDDGTEDAPPPPPVVVVQRDPLAAFCTADPISCPPEETWRIGTNGGAPPAHKSGWHRFVGINMAALGGAGIIGSSIAMAMIHKETPNSRYGIGLGYFLGGSLLAGGLIVAITPPKSVFEARSSAPSVALYGNGTGAGLRATF